MNSGVLRCSMAAAILIRRRWVEVCPTVVVLALVGTGKHLFGEASFLFPQACK